MASISEVKKSAGQMIMALNKATEAAEEIAAGVWEISVTARQLGLDHSAAKAEAAAEFSNACTDKVTQAAAKYAQLVEFLKELEED